MSERLYACMVTVLLLGTAMAQSQPVAFTFDSPVLSKYVWRGIVTVDGIVWQPSLDMSSHNWSLNLWGNFELDDTNDYGPGFGSGRGKFTELDSTLTYQSSVESLDWTLGAIQYDYPNTGFEKTVEAFAEVSLSGAWSSTLDLYWDVVAVHGVYAGLSVSKTLASSDSDETELTLNVGWATKEHNDYYLGVSKSGVLDYGATVTHSLYLKDTATFEIFASATGLFDDLIADSAGRRNNYLFGASLTLSF